VERHIEVRHRHEAGATIAPEAQEVNVINLAKLQEQHRHPELFSPKQEPVPMDLAKILPFSIHNVKQEIPEQVESEEVTSMEQLLSQIPKFLSEPSMTQTYQSLLQSLRSNTLMPSDMCDQPVSCDASSQASTIADNTYHNSTANSVEPLSQSSTIAIESTSQSSTIAIESTSQSSSTSIEILSKPSAHSSQSSVVSAESRKESHSPADDHVSCDEARNVHREHDVSSTQHVSESTVGQHHVKHQHVIMKHVSSPLDIQCGIPVKLTSSQTHIETATPHLRIKPLSDLLPPQVPSQSESGNSTANNLIIDSPENNFTSTTYICG
jgi:hypothetical protein